MNPRGERPLRLAAVYSHPVQYTAPLFRELSRRPEIDLTVYFLSRQGLDATFDPLFGQSFKWDIPLLDGYEHKFLPNLRNGSAVNGFFKLLNVSVLNELRRKRFDAVLVHGYEHFAKWLAFAGAKLGGAHLILRGESHLNEPRGMMRRAAKRIILGQLFRQFTAFAYVGTLNRNYYESYGVNADRLYFAPYSVDNDFFQNETGRMQLRRTEARRSLGIVDAAPVILSAAKLIDVKQPGLLLEAFGEVRKREACHLVFVGDGALRPQIEALAAARVIPDVHVTGFVNQAKMPEMYGSADIFVLPSRHEPWGLAVNEAMAAGLPVVVTDRVGCAVDLVRDGVNGYITPHDDPNQLAERLKRLVADSQLRTEFGCRSREMIDNWSIEKTADGIIRAATLASQQPTPSPARRSGEIVFSVPPRVNR